MLRRYLLSLSVLGPFTALAALSPASAGLVQPQEPSASTPTPSVEQVRYRRHRRHHRRYSSRRYRGY